MRQQALRWIFLLPIIFGLGFGCQPAGRYPPQESKKSPVEEKTPLPAELAWLEPAPKHAIPILFVPETDKDNWARLPAFWNHFPPAPSGMATGHLGLSPLGAVVTILWTRQIEKIIIKVPRGLPDPTPFLPKSNQPTLGQWKLGKKLFFDKTLPISKIEDLACASCHDPKTGFTEAWAINRLGKMNTPSLINCVYNKHQFWDGRATFLEQVIVKELNDENLPMEQRPVRHSWGGLVKALREKPEYQLRFREVFGVRQPTQDTIAKALAAYLRTILSGNSLYDRAEVERLKLGETELAAKHFEPVLDDAALKNLESTKKEVAAAALVQGYKLFNGQAGCVLCHKKPLFTDNDFHNIGLADNDIAQLSGQEPGRFNTVAIGLKESRLIGAYKTPGLRALPRTAPYMHNGQFKTLDEVVEYFDHGIDAGRHRYLASQLRESPGVARQLNLGPNDARALVLFLRSLEGAAVDPMVAAPK